MGKGIRPGSLFAFEGIDGSGKSTQCKFLLGRLKKEGFQTAFFDFPQYRKKSAGPVEEYLKGTYGSSLDVGAYRASIFFAADRYDASFRISRMLEQGKVVITDRYAGSNIGHQGGKFPGRKERKKFFYWLFSLEYGIFQIPKPAVSLFLKIPPLVAKELCENEERRKKKARDIHEKDIRHLVDAEASYLDAIKMFPGDFRVVECVENGTLLSAEEIHEKVWREVKQFL
ncbi:hypothetical protein KKI17_00440 [Patescibacteria group bacterium]|nr:hypothetical protein [Patescibacteria group bacterium]